MLGEIRATLLWFGLVLVLGTALGACAPAAGEIGLAVPPSPEPEARPDDQEQTVLTALFAAFGAPMHKLNGSPVPSIAIPDASLDLYVSEDGIDAYKQVRRDASGSGTVLPEGTVILRVVRDGQNRVSQYTALVQREPGFNPPSDLWFAVYDTKGERAHDPAGAPLEGPIPTCTSCHLSRASDGYVFGMSQ